ncbi:MAG: helix-hairpin-helix domain-containing protein [Peptostreptococcaceae bacterium]|jgi:competence protein ComEA|nr:helix-hairpin-helix domain-containing protein [Peptostreptococcaceae bacterium]
MKVEFNVDSKKIIVFFFILFVFVLGLYLRTNNKEYLLLDASNKNNITDEEKNKDNNNYNIDEIIVESKEINKIIIYISGEVKNPGVVEIEEDKRLKDAIEEVGGFLDEADTKNINLAMKLEDEGHYIIPKIGELKTDTKNEAIVNTIDKKANNKSKSNLININNASKQELIELPGIGEVTANKIIDFRSKNKFSNVNDLLMIDGIGEKKLEKIKAFIRCN